MDIKNNQRRKRKIRLFEIETDELRMRRWKRLRDVKVKSELKRTTGPDNRFRRGQKPAVEAIIVGKGPVVVVMPTGGSKSLLFMLAAWYSRGSTTIVIVWLIALRQDIKQICEEIGITCAEWSSNKPLGTVSVMLVIPERR